jgi:release factor glutamine methyltransferase
MVRRGREFLERRGIESARLESELLVAHALGLERLELFLQHERPVSADEVTRARELLVRRGKREPTAYITGRREFYGRAFQVGPGVLIPRPETELVVDRAREIARERAGPGSVPGRAGAGLERAADFGTGSGCLAITLALEIDGLCVLGVDVSDGALRLARANAAALGAERVEFVAGDGFALLGARAHELGRGYDLLVANPPYVEPAEAADLSPEVLEHEPPGALFAPDDDPDHYVRRLLDAAPALLAPSGTLLVELGHRQAPRVRALAEARGLSPRLHRDQAGIDRVLEVRR